MNIFDRLFKVDPRKVPQFKTDEEMCKPAPPRDMEAMQEILNNPLLEEAIRALPRLDKSKQKPKGRRR